MNSKITKSSILRKDGKDDKYGNHYKIISGKMKELFGLPIKIIPKIKYDLMTLYNNSSIDKPIKIEHLHQLIIKYFISDYYPIISRNIRVTKYTVPVIMGGVGFNMNLPPRLKFMNINTDDIDLKIYTTEINYLEQNTNSLKNVMSILKFSTLIICMYIKQIMEIITNFTEYEFNISRNTISHKYIHKHTLKHVQEPKYKPKYVKDIKIHHGGRHVIFNKFENGKLKNYKIIIQIKDKNEHNINVVTNQINLEDMEYPDVYSCIMDNVVNVDSTISFKIAYKMIYGKNIGMKSTINRNVTFSDCKVIYPSLETSNFFSYYLLHNIKYLDQGIDILIKKHIPIQNIIEFKHCGNNCKYIAIDSLMLDIVLMLSFANYLVNENLENGGKILVSIGYLYKYWKYLIKFLRLCMIKKFLKGELNGTFQEPIRKLEQYIKNTLRKTSIMTNETDIVSIEFKHILNNFHQAFFINKTLITNTYPELLEIANEFERLVFYINCSRTLFTQLNNESNNKGTTINSIAIQYANVEMSKYTISQTEKNEKIEKLEKLAILNGGNKKNIHNIIKLYEDQDQDQDQDLSSVTKINKLWNDEIIISGIFDKIISQEQLSRSKITNSN